MEHTGQALDANTQLALQRSFLATERTLMAWIRTSISMIGFGFTLAKLFQSLASANVFALAFLFAPERGRVVLDQPQMPTKQNFLLVRADFCRIPELEKTDNRENNRASPPPLPSGRGTG